MAKHWPIETQFTVVEPKFDTDVCTECGSRLYFRVDRDRRLYTLARPLMVRRLRARCSNHNCSNSRKALISQEERELALSNWKIGWDVFCWIGFRRFKRHWSVLQIREELHDSYDIQVSEDAIESYIRQYQTMVSARHQDLERVADRYREVDKVILSIDGLQPEKGHETLYVIRELRLGRVWIAEPLISSSTPEMKRLVLEAERWCKSIGVKVTGWVSDKQCSLVKAVKAIYPEVPHRYCHNHFLRDLAKQITEIDSNAKVKMRSKIRGLRGIEKEVLESLSKSSTKGTEHQSLPSRGAQIVLDYCSAVRGILNNNSGGPLLSAGQKMYLALEEMRDSLHKLLALQRGAVIDHWLKRLANYIELGTAHYDLHKNEIVEGTRLVRLTACLLKRGSKPSKRRLKEFRRIAKQLSNSTESIKMAMGRMMLRFCNGLFAGGDDFDIPVDNLDLERWFKNPKGHSRRITGNRHVGTKSVYEGPTLIPALDAHLEMEKPLTYIDLTPYIDAEIPISEQKATERKRTMTRAASKKKEAAS